MIRNGAIRCMKLAEDDGITVDWSLVMRAQSTPVQLNFEASSMPDCQTCGRKRTEADVVAYDPVQVITGEPLGWYSNVELGEEICNECMEKFVRRGGKE